MKHPGEGQECFWREGHRYWKPAGLRSRPERDDARNSKQDRVRCSTSPPPPPSPADQAQVWKSQGQEAGQAQSLGFKNPDPDSGELIFKDSSLAAEWGGGVRGGGRD